MFDEAREVVVTVGIPFPELSDDQVRLRPWRRDDVPAMLVAFTDPVFDLHSDWAPKTEADVVAHLDRLDERRRECESINLAIVEPDEPDITLGGVSVNGIDQVHLRASIGYWLSPPGRGRGLATRSVKLLADWAFADLGLARLELTCGPENVASQRVAARCGFQREGLLRSHIAFKGARRDTIVYSRLA